MADQQQYAELVEHYQDWLDRGVLSMGVSAQNMRLLIEGINQLRSQVANLQSQLDEARHG